MKKVFVLLIFTLTLLIGCSSNQNQLNNLKEEGIAPFELTENEEYLLQSLDLQNNSQVISFNAPREAITLKINVKRLKDGEGWDDIQEGKLSIGSKRQPIDKLEGTFTMILKENYAVDFNVDCGGLYSYKIEKPNIDTENMIFTKAFLTNIKDIEINKEIPIAIMVYDSETSMSSYSLEDYFEPSKFKGMDLVQVVTLTFTEEEL